MDLMLIFSMKQLATLHQKKKIIDARNVGVVLPQNCYYVRSEVVIILSSTGIHVGHFVT